MVMKPLEGSGEQDWSKKLSDKTVDDYLVRHRAKVSGFSVLASLSGLLGAGAVLFIVALIVYCVW